MVRKNNPLKQGLKAAKNINIVDNPAEEALGTTVDEALNVSTGQEVVNTPFKGKASTIEKKSMEVPIKTSQKNTSKKRGRGRPPGKKSDPKTTQAGGYVNEDLYLDVQITLTQLKRKFIKRSEVNVSTLMGALFSYFQGLSKSEQEAFLREYGNIDDANE